MVSLTFVRSLQDLKAGSIYGLEKLWALFHYGPGIPQDSGVEVNPKARFWHGSGSCGALTV